MVNDEEIKALQDELEATKGELETKVATVSELEQAIAARDSEISTLKQSTAETVASYKAMVVQANPGVMEELITGDTIEAINQSLESAKALISKVRQGLEAEVASGKIPAGAPQRTTPDLSALSPREKIQYAIGGRTK